MTPDISNSSASDNIFDMALNQNMSFLEHMDTNVMNALITEGIINDTNSIETISPPITLVTPTTTSTTVTPTASTTTPPVLPCFDTISVVGPANKLQPNKLPTKRKIQYSPRKNSTKSKKTKVKDPRNMKTAAGAAAFKPGCTSTPNSNEGNVCGKTETSQQPKQVIVKTNKPEINDVILPESVVINENEGYESDYEFAESGQKIDTSFEKDLLENEIKMRKIGHGNESKCELIDPLIMSQCDLRNVLWMQNPVARIYEIQYLVSDKGPAKYVYHTSPPNATSFSLRVICKQASNIAYKIIIGGKGTENYGNIDIELRDIPNFDSALQFVLEKSAKEETMKLSHARRIDIGNAGEKILIKYKHQEGVISLTQYAPSDLNAYQKGQDGDFRGYRKTRTINIAHSERAILSHSLTSCMHFIKFLTKINVQLRDTFEEVSKIFMGKNYEVHPRVYYNTVLRCFIQLKGVKDNEQYPPQIVLQNWLRIYENQPYALAQ